MRLQGRILTRRMTDGARVHEDQWLEDFAWMDDAHGDRSDADGVDADDSRPNSPSLSVHQMFNKRPELVGLRGNRSDVMKRDCVLAAAILLRNVEVLRAKGRNETPLMSPQISTRVMYWRDTKEMKSVSAGAQAQCNAPHIPEELATERGSSLPFTAGPSWTTVWTTTF